MCHTPNNNFESSPASTETILRSRPHPSQTSRKRWSRRIQESQRSECDCCFPQSLFLHKNTPLPTFPARSSKAKKHIPHIYFWYDFTWYPSQVIRECTKKNREGAPDFLSLVDSIHKNLKTNVSASHWRHSEQYLDHFMKQKYEVGREITGRAA